MQKGFARPLLIIAVLLLLGVPATLLYRSGQLPFIKNSSNVKGVSTVSASKPGLEFYVVSADGTWELVKYLCKTLEECSKSLDSGVRDGSINGGQTSLQKLFISSDTSWVWKEYKYMKVFVRSGMGSSNRNFSVTSLGDLNDSQKVSFGATEVVIIPVSNVIDTFHTSATFSDRL